MSDSKGALRDIRPGHLLMNAVSSYGGNLVDIAVFLALLPFIIDSVGTENFGLWSLVWAIVSVLAMVDLGFSQSVVKFVADARGRNETDRQRDVVCTLFWVFSAQMIVILALVGGACLCFDRIFDVPPDKVETARLVLLIVGGGFAAGVPFGTFRGVMIGHQRQWVPNVYRIGSTIVYSTLVFILLRIYPDLRTLAALNLIVTVLPLMAVAIHARATIPLLSLHPRHFRMEILREVWSHSFYFMLINVSTLIYTRVDTFIIQASLDLTAVALYALAMRVSEQAQNFCLHLTRTLTPVVAELHGAEEEDRLIQVWLKGTKAAVALATPLVIGCAVLARPLLVSWTSEEFLPSVHVLQILLVTVMINVIHSNSAILLSMRGRQRYLAFVLLGQQVANVALSLLLVRDFGILGVACATLITSIPFQFGLVQGRLRSLHGLTFRAYYGQTVVPSVLPTLLMVGVIGAWEYVHPVTGLLEVACVEATGAVVFGIAFWRLGMNPDERSDVAGLLRRVVKKRHPRCREGES